MSDPTYSEFGRLWQNTTAHGNVTYFSGDITLPDGSLVRISVFPNSNYEPGTRRPQFIVYANNRDITLHEHNYEAVPVDDDGTADHPF